jgi:hydroxypyruvate reductase
VRRAAGPAFGSVGDGEARFVLLDCFGAALQAVDGRAAVARQLCRDALPGEWQLAAVGKAAAAMSLGALDVLGGRIVGGLVVTPGGAPLSPELDGYSCLRRMTSAHPLPDERSLAAGAALREAIATSPVDSQWLVLVSGGASSLIEDPVAGASLADLRRLNEWALAAGMPIGAINALRRRYSRLKGGGLARLLGSRRCRALLVSDVPGDDPRVIGSGLLHAGDEALLSPTLPAYLDRWWHGLPVTPAGPCPRVRSTIVATAGDACRAVVARARAAGWQAEAAPRRVRGDAERLGRRLAGQVTALSRGSLRVWGGETTVRLPPQPGRGGRNQQLALAAALALDGHPGIALLAAGTDGIDGASEDAGAIVDGGSVLRMRDGGVDPRRALRDADAGTALAASGDLVHTGPTGTNVGDLLIAAAER